MSNAKFPVLPGLKWDVTKAPQWLTKVQRSIGGKEVRAAFWSAPLYTWTLSYELLRASVLQEFQTLIGFFNARQGKFDSFLFSDPADNNVTSQNFGTGDGSKTQFQLKRTFGGSDENIRDLNIPPDIFVSGVLKTGSLFDYEQPLPSFIEGWASNSFHAQDFDVPTGVASIVADSEGEHILMMTVSGAAGASSVTGAGFDATNGTGQWACVIQHDDLTYGIYTASGITTTSLNVSPPLRGTVTSKPCHSLGGSLNGQHYGQLGYKALARMIFAQNKRSGYRNAYANRFRATDLSGWTLVGGLPGGSVTYNVNGNQWPGAAGTGSYMFARGTKTLNFFTATVGRGVSRTVSLGGATGYLEAFVGIDASGGAGAFRVVVVVDSVTLLDATYTAFQRIVVPFSAGTSGTITITNNTSTNTGYRIGDVTWWSYDRADVTWTDPVIGKNDKVVVLGDSWSARYSGGLGLELAQAQIDAGGTSGSVTTVALAGQTAEWGLANFDTLVRPLAPNVVVIEFFVNDFNSFGLANSARWLAALYQIGVKCQQIGARPVFVMPLPTQSSVSTGGLGVWSELIGNVDSADYSINSSGLVTFKAAPANGAVLTWTGSYYWRVRFSDDIAEFNNFLSQLWEAKKVTLVSVKT